MIYQKRKKVGDEEEEGRPPVQRLNECGVMQKQKEGKNSWPAPVVVVEEGRWESKLLFVRGGKTAVRV